MPAPSVPPDPPPTAWRARLARAIGPRARGAGAYFLARPWWQRAALVLLVGTALVLMALLLTILALIPLTPGLRDLQNARAAQPSVIVAADGKELYKFEQGLQQRVPLRQIAPVVVAALIATEDHRFYEHHGIDLRRTAAAAVSIARGDMQGGSTITQQLARNMFPDEIGRSRNILRKLKEMVVAVKIESALSKPEILEAYLNTVPFLYNTFGIEMAARTYFGKPAARLDVLEAATLVGMLKGTNYYNPVTSPERSRARRNVVLGQLLRSGYLTRARFDQLRQRPLRLHFARQSEHGNSDNETHFTNLVKRWLSDWADANDYNLNRDGLVVHTTIDPVLQEAAQRAVDKDGAALQAVADLEWSEASAPSAGVPAHPFAWFWRAHPELLDSFVRESGPYRRAVAAGEDGAAALRRLRADGHFMAALRQAKARLEAGFVALDPQTGAVRAWVGSRNFRLDQFDHVAQAARQPGSTFKPVVYGAALEQGFAPDRPYRDAVLDIRAPDGSVWRPTDMHASSGAMVPMRDGLVYSKNTITAQVERDVGLAPIIRLGRALGIRTSKLEAVPSLALGTSPVTLLEMVNAYASIAAGGRYHKPIYITSVTDRSGAVLASFAPEPAERALSESSAVALVDMMRGVVDRGTGTAIRSRFGIRADVAGKTGTTQHNTDGWFILMHPQLVAGAWVGFNDNRVTMRSSYWGQGGHNAILLVGDFFRTALAGGKLDAAAVFPGGRPPPPPAPPAEEVMEDAGEIDDANGAPEPPPPPDLHPRADGGDDGAAVDTDPGEVAPAAPERAPGSPATDTLPAGQEPSGQGAPGGQSRGGPGVGAPAPQDPRPQPGAPLPAPPITPVNPEGEAQQ